MPSRSLSSGQQSDPDLCANDDRVSISRYLLLRLRELGICHVFGTPGDYVLPFYDELEEVHGHGVSHVQPCNEAHAAFAASGYALRAGYGAAVVTYGPGGLSTANGVAGACSDDIPMLVVSGAPAASALATVPVGGRVLHHAVGTDLDAFLCVFAPITVRATRVTSAEDAADLIDGVITDSYLAKKPAYLEIPVDLQAALVPPPAGPLQLNQSSDPATLKRAVDAALSVIYSSPSRAIVVGHLLLRHGGTRVLLRLARKLGAGVATTLCAKHGDLEDAALAVGIYCGALSPSVTLAAVEGSSTGARVPDDDELLDMDEHVVITVGLTNNEMDSGRFTSRLDCGHTLRVGSRHGSRHVPVACTHAALTTLLLPVQFLHMSQPRLPTSIAMCSC